MKTLSHLFENNRRWADRIQQERPGFFSELQRKQAPQYLWIGCSDSRVPANEIVGLWPGELFVHRNVANLVIHTDMNCLSVLQYALEILRIEHVIVCGHYGCGGVKAAMEARSHGFVDNWLRHIRDVIARRAADLHGLRAGKETEDRVCELNIIEQVINVGNTTMVQDAWARGQPVHIHGWIYDVGDGRLKDLGISLSSLADLGRLLDAPYAT